jgi:hypothetical protein
MAALRSCIEMKGGRWAVGGGGWVVVVVWGEEEQEEEEEDEEEEDGGERQESFFTFFALALPFRAVAHPPSDAASTFWSSW